MGCYKGENIKIRGVARQPAGNKELIILWRDVNLHFFPFMYEKCLRSMCIKYFQKNFLFYQNVENVIYISVLFNGWIVHILMGKC